VFRFSGSRLGILGEFSQVLENIKTCRGGKGDAKKAQESS